MPSNPYVTMLSTQMLPTRGYTYSHNTESSLTALFLGVAGKKGASVFEGPSICVVELASASSTYLFTRPGHFAHASVLIRKTVKGPSGRLIEVSGVTATEGQAMEEWLLQFRAEAREIRRAYARVAEA